MQLEEMSVTLRLTESQLGTVPKDKEVYRTYIAGKAAESKGEEEVATVPEMEEKGWTGFHTDGEGMFIYDYMIRGFLKNAGTIMKGQFKAGEAEVKQLKSKIDNLVFVFPRKIYFMRDGECIKEPEEVIERPLRGMTAQGPRVCLVRSDAVKAGATLTFTLKIMPGLISKDHLEQMFEYGQLCGLGQFRNGSYGRFEVVK